MGTTAIEPGKGSWRIEELENMDSLTPERKKKGQAKTKAIRAKWREQGLCTRCGREREDPNLLTCEHCRRGDRERKCKR